MIVSKVRSKIINFTLAIYDIISYGKFNKRIIDDIFENGILITLEKHKRYLNVTKFDDNAKRKILASDEIQNGLSKNHMSVLYTVDILTEIL